jgi:hypothetical protein
MHLYEVTDEMFKKAIAERNDVLGCAKNWLGASEKYLEAEYFADAVLEGFGCSYESTPECFVDLVEEAFEEVLRAAGMEV